MKNLSAIQSEFQKIKSLDANTVLANLSNLSVHGQFDTREDLLSHIENNIFDNEDREIYYNLLERKPVSYDFCPSLLARAWGVLAILSVIRP
jgi:hypothetical protein